jgi:formate dehydrogenase subunit gamma
MRRPERRSSLYLRERVASPMQHLDGWDTERAASLIAAELHHEGATLPILHALQDAFGFIPDEAIPMVAAALNLSRAEVFGVVGFYHEFRRHPAGRRVVKLCRAEACQSMGGEALAAQARDRLGVEWHGTTPDGAVTLEPVYCLGLCATAPAGMVDGEVIGRLTPARLDAILETVR